MKQSRGYVYILSNRSMPGLLKVGMTTRTPQQRARELSGNSAVPTPFVVEFAWQVRQPHQAEQLAHQVLASHHHSKEYYRVPLKVALSNVGNRLQHAGLCSGSFGLSGKHVTGPTLQRGVHVKQMAGFALLCSFGLTSWASQAGILAALVFIGLNWMHSRNAGATG